MAKTTKRKTYSPKKTQKKNKIEFKIIGYLLLEFSHLNMAMVFCII